MLSTQSVPIGMLCALFIIYQTFLRNQKRAHSFQLLKYLESKIIDAFALNLQNSVACSFLVVLYQLPHKLS